MSQVFRFEKIEVDHRHELLGYLGIAAFSNGMMVVAQFIEAAIRPLQSSVTDEMILA